MSIKKNGKWLVKVETGKDPITCKRKRCYATSYSKEKVKLKEAEMLEEVQMGIKPNAGEITVAAHLNKFLQKQKNKLYPRTYYSYEIIIERHLIPALGSLYLQQLPPYIYGI
jgi:integrase